MEIKIRPLLLAGLLLLSAALLPSDAATHYVYALSTNEVPPYTNWTTAAVSIQSAITAAVDNALILVSNGVYATGGTVVHGSMSNRVALTNQVTVEAVNGPEFTVIEGSGPLGDSAIRCAFVGNGAVLSGFTLTNGFTRTAGNVFQEQSGGGAWCEAGGTLSNCTIVGCSAEVNGGGGYNGYYIDCTFVTNWSGTYGGGAYFATLSDCDLIGNVAATNGGGATACQIFDCVLSNNTAFVNGGGAFNGSASNCTITGNHAFNGGGVAAATGSSTTWRRCIIRGNTATNGAGTYNGNLRDECLVVDNTASLYGGGSYFSSIVGCTLTNNSATSATSAWGGGAVGGALTDCTIVSNTSALLGGGTYNSTMTNCMIRGNAASQGGGVYFGDLVSCTLEFNTATVSGGGASQASLTNCTFRGNSAQYGGGSRLSDLMNCTMTDNSATINGGGASGGTVTNCIVYYNTTNGLPNNTHDNTADYSCTIPDPGGTSNITSAPILANHAAGDYDLLAGSPCIDAGTTNGAPETDFAGIPRPLNGDGLDQPEIDIGAYEHASLTADTDSDGQADADEIIADTDPTDINSLLTILNISLTNGWNRVEWQGGVKARQFVEFKEDLVSTTEQWTAIFTNNPPTAVVTNIVDTGATNAAAFYRIKAEKAP